jgi:lipopolysaccharide export system protein LptA
MAQQPATAPFGGFSPANSKAPIDIQADSLVINDTKKIAIYKGNVIAVQGETTLRTVELEVQYASKDDAAGQKGKAPKAKGAAGAVDESSQQIKRIKAKQKVVMTSSREQTATGDEADYDVATQTVVLTGNVILKQGENILKGHRLVVDMKTGESRMESTPAGGRISTVLHPQQKDQGKAPEKGAPAAGGEAAKPAAKPSTSSWDSTTTTLKK